MEQKILLPRVSHFTTRRGLIILTFLCSIAAGSRVAGAPHSALDFAPKTVGSTTDAYLKIGNPAKLGLQTFTIEARFRQQGVGSTSTTSPNSVAVPLVTKGRDQCENCSADINYFLGISNGVLFADFEEGSTGASPGLNHPITGVTTIQKGVWYHAAATYDGTKWQLFLNGVLESELVVGQPTKSDSTQPVAIATALNSKSGPQGYFNGVIDEVRIWNYARSAQQILAGMDVEISAETGLAGRWGMDEGTGITVNDSTATPANGTIIGQNYCWVHQPPQGPRVNGPLPGSTDISTSAVLDVNVSDGDTDNVTVTYYGRQKPAGATSPDFTLVALPDTQYYVSKAHGGSPVTFNLQTQWIVDNKSGMNIANVVHLGDCVYKGDNGGNTLEWDRAWSALSKLEDPATTLLTYGIPYGVSVGNHDQSPEGSGPSGSTTLYNQYFGETHFAGRSYYGGHYGTNNNNWFDLFTASDLDFIVLSLEYDPSANSTVLQWANNVLQTYSNRRAIVVSHFIANSSGDINSGIKASFGVQGQAIYNALKGNPNLFLMLSAHITKDGEGQRYDAFAGHTVYSLVSNYQSRASGGNGWLRIYQFSPANNQILAKTYSPLIDQFETDADSQFTLSYNMQDSGNSGFILLGANANVPSGSNTTFSWANLSPATTYEWYVTVSDGNVTTTGPVWQFTTASASP